MKIFHGENIVESRANYQAYKEKYPTPTNIGADNLTIALIGQYSNTQDMFGNQPVLVCENFFTRRKSKTKTDVSNYLASNPDLNLIFWENDDVSSELKNFPPSTISYSPYPKIIFTFLDTLSLVHFHQTLKHNPPEQIFTLLVRHLHNLLLAQSGSKNFPAWQIAKLKHQAQKINPQLLLKKYSELLEIDYRQKNSLSPHDLATALELWLQTL